MEATICKAQAAKQQDPNNKRHQTSPSFALAALKAAISEVASGIETEVVVSEGGFTDVGQHRGSEPRDSVWPLVREVWRVSGKGQGEGSTQCYAPPTSTVCLCVCIS